jgi:epoxyqueuosine reductase
VTALCDSPSIVERCRALGFAAAGVCRAQRSPHEEAVRQWVRDGRHGAMDYMADELDARVDPAMMVPGARSVIVVADRYATGTPDVRDVRRGRVARYARGEDYHVVMRARLDALADELRRTHVGHRFRVCVDTAPTLEREHAERAGLGRIGKNTLLIGADGLGSWLVLGVIVTTLELVPLPSASGGDGSTGDPCGSCTRCVDACPTGAISPWSVDARTCLSALTIESADAVPDHLAAAVGDWIFGCDICQEVCPHNQPTRRSREWGAHPAYEPYAASFDVLEVLGWTTDDWDRARLHGALRRATRDMWVRNAALAAGCALRERDAPSPLTADERGTLHARVAELAEDVREGRSVREAARWAADATAGAGG